MHDLLRNSKKKFFYLLWQQFIDRVYNVNIIKLNYYYIKYFREVLIKNKFQKV